MTTPKRRFAKIGERQAISQAKRFETAHPLPRFEPEEGALSDSPSDSNLGAQQTTRSLHRMSLALAKESTEEEGRESKPPLLEVAKYQPRTCVELWYDISGMDSHVRANDSQKMTRVSDPAPIDDF